MKFHRTFLATAAALALGAGVATAQDLTVTSFGGAYGAAQKEHMIDPFMEQSDVNILFEDYGGGVAEMKAQSESGNIQWDVVDIEVIDLERACSEGYLEVIDHSMLPPGDDGTPASEDFIPEALHGGGVGNTIWTSIFAYNNEADGYTENGPSTIADLFDTETFPGKRGLRKRPQVNLEWALMAQDRKPQLVRTPWRYRRKPLSPDELAPSPSSTPSRTTSSGTTAGPRRPSC